MLVEVGKDVACLVTTIGDRVTFSHTHRCSPLGHGRFACQHTDAGCALDLGFVLTLSCKSYGHDINVAHGEDRWLGIKDEWEFEKDESG